MSEERPSFASGLVGITLDGRYRLDAVLGEGGMGSVFRAQHLAMDRRVAVKLLKPHLVADEIALQRFAAEARRTLRVDSPHAVKVLDFGVTEGKDYYIVLEYLDGRTVQRELEVDGPFAPARVIHIARQTLRALGAAHASGLVHRDIKPENMLLMRVDDDPDFTKVLDFGVAKLMQGAAVSDRSRLAMTAQGMVFGTPEFMSPEQACGLPLDGRSDLYSLAATMFAMLTGAGLFEAATPIAWLTAHARTPPPHLAQLDPSLAAYGALDALLQRCLAKRAEHRPADADAMAAELAAIADGKPSDPAASSSSNKKFKPMFSRSLYIEAIPEGPPTVSLGPPRVAAHGPTALVSAVMRPPTVDGGSTGAHAVGGARRGRGVRIAGGAAVVAVGLIVATIVMATRGSEGTARGLVPMDASATAVAATPADAVVALPDAAAAVVSAEPVVDGGGLPPDAAVVAVRTVLAPVPPIAPKPPTEVEKHVAAAQAAQRAGNKLRQMAEADAARRLEPTNVRATYLLADVLISTGDADRGCQYLRGIKHFPLAAARSRAAGCPP